MVVKAIDDLVNSIAKTTAKTTDEVISSNSLTSSIGDSLSTFGKKADELLPNKIDDNLLVTRRTLIPKPLKNTDTNSVISPDELAQKLGFQNEDDFFNYINEFQKVGNWDKLKNVFTLLRSNKKTIAVLGAAASSLALLDYCKFYQALNSGCFRYRKKKDGGYREKSRTKIGGNYCSPLTDVIGVKIKAEKHPLYNLEKWNCNIFEDKGLVLTNEIADILDLGCGGLCDIEHYNKLVREINAKGESTYEPINIDKHKYIYRCERVTILRILTKTTGDAIDEIITGAINSNLGQRFTNIFNFGNLRFYIIIFIIFLIYYKFFCKRNNNTLPNEPPILSQERP